jgi:hypothetical protein
MGMLVTLQHTYIKLTKRLQNKSWEITTKLPHKFSKSICCLTSKVLWFRDEHASQTSK